MVPDIVQAVAVYVGLVRDLLLLVMLLAILIIVFAAYRKVSRALDSANRVMENAEEIVNNVSENIVRPASSGAGAAFALGKVFAFLRGTKK